MRGHPAAPRDMHAGVVFFGGGGGTTSTNTVQQATPWSGEQGSLLNIYGQAQALDQNNVPQYYSGNTYAPLTGEQEGLMSNLIGNTYGGGGVALQGANNALGGIEGGQYVGQTSGNFGNANNVLGNEMSSSYLNPANSPTYNTAISNAMAQALPAANASFVNGNRSDSGLASAASSAAAANAAAGLAQQQYNVNQGIQNQAVGQASQNQIQNQQQQLQGAFYAPFVDQQRTSDMGTALNTAGMDQTNAQNQIDANVARWNYNQMLPWNQLGMYESAVTGTGNPGSTVSSQSQVPYYSNTAANVASGISGLGSLGLLAYSLGAFSDRDLKSDIHRIGETDSGFPLYTFRYKWEPPMSFRIGVMAQDVEKTRPHAVIHTPIGRMVNYIEALAA